MIRPYDVIVSEMRERRSRRDNSQLHDGLSAFRIKRAWGQSLVAKAASEAGLARSTLYEYRAVWDFYWQTWREVKLSAWRILRIYPSLTYTHLRDAMKLEDFGEALAALDAVTKGDDRYPKFMTDTPLPMTTESFGIYINLLLGNHTPPRTFFEDEGPGPRLAGLIRTIAAQNPEESADATIVLPIHKLPVLADILDGALSALGMVRVTVREVKR